MADEKELQGLSPEQTESDKPSANSDGRTFSAEYVQELRDEAAKARIAKREASEAKAALEAKLAKIDEAKLVEQQQWKELAEQRASELETLKTQMAQKELERVKLETINDMGLPGDALEFLTGGDAETIKAQAEKFKGLIPETPQAGGQTPRRATTAIPGGEPIEETREQRNRRLGLRGSGHVIN